MSAKARLPLVADRPSARAASSAADHVANACIVRASGGRALLCVLDEGSGDAALRFARAVLERVWVHGGSGCAQLSSEALHAGASYDALLTVRLGVRSVLARSVECDLEVARDDGLIATLIGDWIGTHIQDVSAEGCATPAKSPRA